MLYHRSLIKYGNWNGYVGDKYRFVQVIPSGVKAVAVATCCEHDHLNIAVKTDGSAWAAGFNHGQNAKGTFTYVKVIDSGVEAVAVGHDQLCLVLKQDGSVWLGTLGSGAATPIFTLLDGGLWHHPLQQLFSSSVKTIRY